MEKTEGDAASSINPKESDRPSRSRDRHEVSFQSRRKRSQSRNRRYNGKQDKSCRKCGNCGGYAPRKNPCPARGKTCNACGKSGHFAHVAPAKTFQTSDEEYVYVYTINYQENKKPPMCQLQINGTTLEMMIDSGASVNLLDGTSFQRINSSGNENLKPTHTKIYSSGCETPLPLLGTFTTTVKSSNASTSAPLLVKGKNGNLLSYHTAQKLGLITVSVNTATVTDGATNSPEFLKEDFFVRRRLEKLDIIKTVEDPTPWISPIVVVPKKSGEVRICVDMHEANKAIKREKHLMPTIDDLIADLNGATHFSTLDLSSGYHQLELAPESRYVTTFSTHVGLRRYKRLPFGINAASEIFQESIIEIFSGLPGCKNISDDIIVFG